MFVLLTQYIDRGARVNTQRPMQEGETDECDQRSQNQQVEEPQQQKAEEEAQQETESQNQEEETTDLTEVGEYGHCSGCCELKSPFSRSNYL